MKSSMQLVFIFILSIFLGCGRSSSQDPIAVTINPSFFKLPSGGQVQLSADVSGTLNKGVTWDVNGPLGSSVSSQGLFHAPLNAGGKSATVRAVSQADPNTFGTASISMTSVSKLASDKVVPAGSDTMIVGGYTVRAGQTIDLRSEERRVGKECR